MDTPRLFNIICEYLLSLRTEHEKRSDIYKYGVDLSNYNDINLNVAIQSVAELICILYNNITIKERIVGDIEWWIYETVEKKYYVTKDNIKITIDVEKADDFLKNIILV